MVYNFFDKTFSGGAVESKTMPKLQMTDELQEPAIREFEK